MIEETLASAIKSIRDNTAAPAWIAEILAVFAVFTLGRFGLGVWLFDAVMAGAGAGSGAGIASGVAPAPAAAAAAAELGAGLWWPAWLHAYDSLRNYADSAIIAGAVFTFIFEGGVMFLARKRIRLSKEEARAEMQGQVDAANATIAQYQATATQAAEAAAQAQAATAQAQAATAQATALVEIVREENKFLQERAALQDEQIRQLLEQLAQRGNGSASPNHPA